MGFRHEAKKAGVEMNTFDDGQYSVRLEVGAAIPTIFGNFDLLLYSNNQDDKQHLALVHGDIHSQERVLVRVHSECLTGDILGSLRCDCGEQLKTAIRLIAENGS